MTAVRITVDDAPRMAARCREVIADMKALGMNRHDFFDKDGNIVHVSTRRKPLSSPTNTARTES